jgi:GST-like protein
LIHLYYWPTANGIKIPILLNELGVEYQPHLVNIRNGDNALPDFLALNPNGKIPLLIDHGINGAPLVIHESAAILIHLADAAKRFLPTEPHARAATMQWLFWQVGHVAASFGLYQTFREKIRSTIPADVDALAVGEVERLYQVLEQRLASSPYLAGDYTIADIALFPWIQPARQGRDLAHYPNIRRWRAQIAQRPAVRKAYADGLAVAPNEKSLHISKDWLR